MKAVRMTKGGPRVVSIARPRRRSGEALIRVKYAGLCNTDLEIVRGYMGFDGVLGHEFVGTVEAADSAELVGRRVVGEINVAPKNFFGPDARHAAGREVLGIVGRNGAFAEYVTLPERNLCCVPENVSDLAAVFVEPLAAACQVLESVRLTPGDRVLILGDGKLGLLCAMVLVCQACGVFMRGHHAAKLKIARSLGVEVRPERFPNDGFDVAIEATGSPRGMQAALTAVRPRGTVVLKSTVARPGRTNLNLAVINEITVVGSRCGRFAPALLLLERGLVRPEVLVTKVVRLDAAVGTFEKAVRGDGIKYIFDCG